MILAVLYVGSLVLKGETQNSTKKCQTKTTKAYKHSFKTIKELQHNNKREWDHQIIDIQHVELRTKPCKSPHISSVSGVTRVWPYLSLCVSMSNMTQNQLWVNPETIILPQLTLCLICARYHSLSNPQKKGTTKQNIFQGDISKIGIKEWVLFF